jgi:REP element-mobilizing transposase RayT
MEVMPDHVHLFVSAPPTLAPAQLANQFKGYTSRVLRLQFPHLRLKAGEKPGYPRFRSWCSGHRSASQQHDATVQRM